MPQLRKDKPLKFEYGEAQGFGKSQKSDSFFFSDDISNWIFATSAQGRDRKKRRKKDVHMDQPEE